MQGQVVVDTVLNYILDCLDCIRMLDYCKRFEDTNERVCSAQVSAVQRPEGVSNSARGYVPKGSSKHGKPTEVDFS